MIANKDKCYQEKKKKKEKQLQVVRKGLSEVLTFNLEDDTEEAVDEICSLPLQLW